MKINPPAEKARLVALLLSGTAVCFAVAFGFCIRRWWALTHGSLAFFDAADAAPFFWVMGALVLLLIAVILRIMAGICELIWLERAWSNLPQEHRRVGPIDNVTPIHIFGIAFIPVVAWFWKLALVRAVVRSLELVKKDVPFETPVPHHLGQTACILGWLPPLNLYVAPFLWEMFARRIDRVCLELAQRTESPSS
jgi:hypothetical protein